MKSLRYNSGIILFNIPEISRRGQAVNMQYFHGEIIPPWKPSRDRVNTINLMFIKGYFSKGRHHTFNKTVLHKYPLKSSSKISYLEEKQQKYNAGENHAPTRILVKSMLVPVHFRITHRSARHQRVAPPCT